MYGVKYWILNANGALIPIQKEDIIHWKTFNPDFDLGAGSHLRGMSPLIPATRRLQQDNDSMDSAVAMFQNGGAKGVLFNKDYVDLTPEQKSQLESVIKDKVNNKLVKASVAALQGEWGYLDLGLSGVDMQLLGSQELTLKRLCALFGVPYELFQSDTTFANKEMAMKSFIVNTIQPMCRSLADELNRVLIPAFKGGYYLEFDFSSVAELQNDLTKLGVTYQAMFDRGAITLNEYRKLMGFDETTNPDHNNYFISGNYAPLTDLNIPNEPDLGQDGL
jgi:HK97 family phage portal protein